MKTLGQIAREAGNEVASWESDWSDEVFEAIAAAVRNEALEEAAAVIFGTAILTADPLSVGREWNPDVTAAHRFYEQILSLKT